MIRSLNSAGPFFKNAFGHAPGRQSVLSPSSPFTEADVRESCDDFLDYVAGSYSVLGTWGDKLGAIGWLSAWYFALMDFIWCDDDFTSYTAGSYASLSGGNGWLTDWSFVLMEYTWCDDDFSSYTAGSYSSLNGGNGWLGAWSFA